ncbi:gamma-glutamyltransferase [Collimonas fungivorans]|uniref:Glutathione hydrolase proenzyme n=1 Tax=Collimonas fungivorans (strain Ter331) TaxID=1005048 RepID=G0AEQ1_COLFT|nr:gamma-glutamyltransferase [Collimonas fungivorans]AEK60186.1 Gamma-glutamyltranspeptidase [Collimonas fungivorans Ter331]
MKNIQNRMSKTILVATLAVSSFLAGCGGSTGGIESATALSAGAAATGDNFSAQVAQQILNVGGNAVDAAVATAFALTVTYPEAGNIGGGGFMTIYMNGQPYFLDYREMAPAATSTNFYTQFTTADGKEDPQSSIQGAQAVGVPGTVMGLWTACQKFCKLPWQQLLAPAIALARDGYLPAQAEIDSYKSTVAGYQVYPYPFNLSEYFGGMTAGQLFRQPDLAATLERISATGADEFYKGKTADLLVASMTQDGGKGVITKGDLASYKAVWREPISFNWKGMTVLTAPPPSSGGIALAQLLGMKADLNGSLFSGVSVNTAQYIHLSAEIMKRVFADRAQFLGDPDFVTVPVSGLLDPTYIAQRAAEVNPTSISPTASVQPGKPKFHTTHFSIIDKWGNAVSNTYTLNNPYGSGVVVRGAGFVLNDEMDDFATVPGQPNSLGVIGGDANAVAPGKRPLSSMSPSILLKNGQVAMVIGTPGGSHIFTSLYQVLSDVYDYNMSLADSVKNMRFHHQLPQGTVVYYEPYAPFPPSLVSELATRGYTVQNGGFNTDVQAIQVVNGSPLPVSDPRGRGASVIAR